MDASVSSPVDRTTSHTAPGEPAHQLAGANGSASIRLATGLSPADYLRHAREIGRGPARAVPVYILSSFSAEFLAPYVVVESYRAGLHLDVSVAPFMQFEQPIRDLGSPIGRRQARVVTVFMRPDDIDPDLYQAYIGREQATARLNAILERLTAIVRDLRRNTDSTIVVANAAPPPASTHNVAIVDEVHQFNRRLTETVSGLGDCYVFDWAGAVAAFGVSRFVDWRLWYLARAPAGHAASAALAERFGRFLAALFVPRAKCVVVDLDNTLWGGVLGDDGLGGIVLGGDYPGNVYRDLQRALKACRARGVLLALASKNHESVARDAFDRHPEMVLRWDDFAAHRVNWRPKAANIREIAGELNIGADSLVFLDDDPVECESIRRELPEVTTVCLGRDPLRFRETLDSIAALDQTGATEEDRARAQMYQQDARRRAAAPAAASPVDFLSSLAMAATVGECDDYNLARVAQLIGKTNQFNLTTRRHDSAALREMMRSPHHRVAYLRLRDTYGDLGLVCVGIVAESPARSWRIDTLLMSCRVMGRGVEDAFLSYLAGLVSAAGGTELVGEYVPSAKNTMVRTFYPDRGFTPVAGDDEVERARLDLSARSLPWPAHVQCRLVESA